MGTKHVNDDKDASFNRSRGRDSDAKPSESSSTSRERNVGHSDAEEHSRTAKGNRG